MNSKSLKSFIKKTATFIIFGLTINNCTEDKMEMLLLPGGGIKPVVIATYPVNQQVGVSPGSPIYVLFNMEMDSEKTQDTFRLSSGSGKADGIYSWEGYKMIFQPRNSLNNTGEYVMTIGAQSENKHGVDLGEDFTIHFFAGSDNSRPTFISSTPANADINVANNTNITLSFSEAIDFATINNGISISPSFLYTTTQSADKTQIIFIPSSILAPGTYTIAINKSLNDLSGNELENESIITFIVGSDFIGPSIFSVTSGATALSKGLRITGIERIDPIVITFSEPMSTSVTEDAVSISPFSIVNKTWNVTNDVLTFSFPTGLDSETEYTLFVDATATDQSGNLLTSSNQYPFYTDGTNSINPKVLSVEQLDSTGAAVLSTLSDFSAIDISALINVDPGPGLDEVIGLRITFSQNMVRNTLISYTNLSKIIDSTSTSMQIHSIVVAGSVMTLYIKGNPFAAHGITVIPLWRIKIGKLSTDTNGNSMISDFTIDLTY